MTWEQKAIARIQFFADLEDGDDAGRGIAGDAIQCYRDETTSPPLLVDLATRLACSQRSLQRHMQATTGMPIRTFLAQLRSIRALIILALCPHVSCSHVAHLTGYTDDRTVRRAIIFQFGVRSQEVRECPVDLLEAILDHREWVESWWGECDPGDMPLPTSEKWPDLMLPRLKKSTLRRIAVSETHISLA